jgi:hypothetical protein
MVLVGVLFWAAFSARSAPAVCSPLVSAVAKPDSTAADLARRLAKAQDYGARNGWLAARLFPLANEITVTGRVKKGYPVGAVSDGDFEFCIELSASALNVIKSHFEANTKTLPSAVNVEIVPSFTYLGTKSPFTYWGATCRPWCVQYAALGATKSTEMTLDADVKKLLNSGVCVEVTGSLTIDMVQSSPGGGQLEIHPVSKVRVVPQSRC